MPDRCEDVSEQTQTTSLHRNFIGHGHGVVADHPDSTMIVGGMSSEEIMLGGVSDLGGIQHFPSFNKKCIWSLIYGLKHDKIDVERLLTQMPNFHTFSLSITLCIFIQGP